MIYFVPLVISTLLNFQVTLCGGSDVATHRKIASFPTCTVVSLGGLVICAPTGEEMRKRRGEGGVHECIKVHFFYKKHILVNVLTTSTAT